VNHGGRLLDQAIGYTLDAIRDVTPALLSSPTPCREWNLDVLLRHTGASLDTIQDGIVTGRVGPIPAEPADPPVDPAGTLRDRLDRCRAARTLAGPRHRTVAIFDRPLPTVVVQCTAALEIAVHGWDISQACRRYRPIPGPLAIGLLALAPLLIPEAGRHPLFDPPVRPGERADPTDRLVAFLGREPGTTATA
jgi:uncharacterized protein (TIGR03086 family)